MQNYIKIPREIIYNQSIGNKRVITFSYLCSRKALDDTVAFSISELCHWSKLKPNYHDGKVNQKYLETLQSFSQLNYFESYPDFEKLLKEKKIPLTIIISYSTLKSLIFLTTSQSFILMRLRELLIIKKNLTVLI